MQTVEPKYTKEQQDHLEFFNVRKGQLMDARKSVFGQDIEALWRQADADYIPHEITSGSRNKVEDYRSESYRNTILPNQQWRSNKANLNPYTKVQSALSIMIGQNPQAVFTPDSAHFEATNQLMYELYKRTWTDVRIGQKKEFRKFVFNLSKYGWSVARRYHKKKVRDNVQHIVNYNTDTDTYDLKKGSITDIDDVYFENKSPWSVWIDDMAKADDPYSRRDWMWKEVFDIDTFKKEFERFPNSKLVEGKSFQGQVEEGKIIQERQFESTDLVEVFYYENKLKDLMLVVANDILVVAIPLPYEHKQLSLIDSYWTLRNAECPYGIGIPEIMRNNNTMLDQFRNMTIDQIRMSIYKMFFYQKSEQLGDEDGGEAIKIEPGKGVKVIDPKNITFLEVPGPGRDAWEGIKMLSEDVDGDTGITRTLEGEVTGKTAFEISQTQQAALKRLTTPLDNIKAALEWDAMLTVALMQTIYSEPTIYRLTEAETIANYLQEINSDPDFYFIDEEGKFNVTQYREFQLGLEKSQDGQFEPAEDKQFFTVKPTWLNWQGTIQIQAESILIPSKSLDRQQKLELFNLVTPLIINPQLSPDLVMKPLKQILKVYDENPKDWLPDAWFLPPQEQQMVQGQPQQQPNQLPQAPTELQQVTPQLQQANTEGGLVQQEMGGNQGMV